MMSLSESRISPNGKAAKTPVFAAFLVNPEILIILIIAFFINKSNLCLGFGPHVNILLIAENVPLYQ